MRGYRIAVKLACYWLVVYPPALLLAGTPPAPGNKNASAPPANGAMVYATGGVELNGAKVPRSSAAFIGDRITTAANAAVVLTLTGSTVSVRGNTSFVYQGDSIELTSGTATVASALGFATRAGALRIAPAAKDGECKYEVTRGSGKITITATECGVVLIENGISTLLPEGHTTQRDDRNRDRIAAPPPLSERVSSTWPTTAGRAAAGGAAVVAILTTRAPASPTKPR